MHLYISNFNKILKIFLVFLVIFISYNVYLVIVKPKVVMFQNQWQENMSYAQDFLYNSNADNIVVGSSMAARMSNDFLGDKFFNLSFRGGSVLTGLEIIKRSGKMPENIFIENNVIFKGKDISMIDTLFYPILWKVKYYIPSFQEKYQPLNIVISQIKKRAGKSHKELIEKKRNDKIDNSQLKIQIDNYSKFDNNFELSINELRELIKYFKAKGVNIYFFEMPIDPLLSDSIKMKQQRDVIKNNFDNKWLELSDNSKYITGDGIHLMYESAYRYSKEFLENVKDFK